MKYVLTVLLILAGNLTFAHQIDLSTVIFSKTDDGKIVMQLTSSLTAFQGEVRYHNSEDAYKTPEEFQQLVIDHFNKTFSMTINGETELKFINPIVLLGHETKLVAEVIGVPENINSVELKNEVFKDINNNQTVVIFSLTGFPANQNFVLNNDNNQTLSASLQNGSWVKVDKSDTESTFDLKYLSLLLIPTLLVLVFLRNKQKNDSLTAFSA